MIERKEPKNLHAVTMFRSWLDALCIDNEPSELYDITVQDSDQNPVEVKIDLEPTLTEPEVIKLNAKDLTGKDINKAKNIFKTFVESLGYEYIDPVNRGEVPEKKIFAKDDFEGVYLRHRDILRSPNPENERLLKYSDVINNVVNSIYRKNLSFFKYLQVEVEDLKSIAMTHTMVFLSQYQVPPDMDLDNNNLKKCYSFLTQRIYYYKSLLQEREPWVTYTSFDHKEAYYIPPVLLDEESDEAYVANHNKFKSKNKINKKKEAKEMLAEELGKMSHDDMVYTLTLASENTHIDPIACKLAKKLLETHISQCSICSLPKESKKSSSMDLWSRSV